MDYLVVDYLWKTLVDACQRDIQKIQVPKEKPSKGTQTSKVHEERTQYNPPKDSRQKYFCFSLISTTKNMIAIFPIHVANLVSCMIWCLLARSKTAMSPPFRVVFPHTFQNPRFSAATSSSFPRSLFPCNKKTADPPFHLDHRFSHTDTSDLQLLLLAIVEAAYLSHHFYVVSDTMIKPTTYSSSFSLRSTIIPSHRQNLSLIIFSSKTCEGNHLMQSFNFNRRYVISFPFI